jgi:negative regulator of flagellin synthesis FlgM
MTHKIDAGPSAIRPPEATHVTATNRAGAERDQAVGAIAAADSVRITGEAEGLQALGRQLGTSPAGIDVARVQALRAAIADGSYQIDAGQIATRMIDLDRQLGK